ncbi:MAG: hypothetical protein LBR61_05445 [Synergistaceae bacterium]|jgi:hypothetical protein|nr:hypothetical protein [Synergistaceae bacterium]
MEHFMWLFVCIAIFSIGDLMGVFTKAKLSSVFVAMFLFLLGFMTGILPADVIDRAWLTEIGRWSSPFIVYHMGTMVKMEELRKEWRTVIMALWGMLIAVGALYLIIPIIGQAAAYVSIPIINGGIVATQIMTTAAMEKAAHAPEATAEALKLAAALGTAVFAMQKLVGTPPTSYCAMKEAQKIIEDFRAKKAAGQLNDKSKTDEPKTLGFFERHNLGRYYTPFVCLGVTAFFAWMSMYLGSVTPINYSIWALVFGVVTSYAGIVPQNILDRGKASGLVTGVVFTSIIPALAKIRLEDLKPLAFQTVLIFAVVLIALYIFIYILPTWKIVGSKNLALGLSMTQLLGFPAFFLIINEVAVASSDKEEEREAVLAKLVPAFVVSNFISVTSISIVIAGIFAPML